MIEGSNLVQRILNIDGDVLMSSSPLFIIGRITTLNNTPTNNKTNQQTKYEY